MAKENTPIVTINNFLVKKSSISKDTFRIVSSIDLTYRVPFDLFMAN
ncbi:MAG: hypothetical protein HOC91_00145 [Nitrospinaceae bacterium]|nr:hypothetical protein [Nitrospinaceae bacterium]